MVMRMDNKTTTDITLERIEDKIDKLDNRIDKIDVTLAGQHVTLVEHTRRSTNNEEDLKLLRSQLNPVFFHVKAINLALKVLLTIFTSSAAGALIKYLFF